MGKPITWDTKKARELYDQGLWDTEIARQVGGVSREQITRWRGRQGLPKNPAPRHAYGQYAPVDVDKERLRELHTLGMRDAQIARTMGVSKHHAQRVRHELGLQANGRRVPTDGALLAVYNTGAYDAEIARRADATQGYVKKWRKQNGLPPHLFDEPLRMHLCRAGLMRSVPPNSTTSG